jgi:hypothetical protein
MVEVTPDYSSAMLPYLQQLQDQDSGRLPGMSGQGYGAGLSQRFGVGPAPSPYDQLASALHRIRASVPNLNPGMDPDSVDAQRAAQAQQPIGDAASQAWNTAIIPERTGAAVNATLLGQTIAPTAANAGENPPKSLTLEESEARQLDQLQAQINHQQDLSQQAVNKARAGAGKSSTVTRDKNGALVRSTAPAQLDPASLAVVTKPYEDNIAGLRSQMDTITQGQAARQPFEQQHPTAKTAIDFGMPALSALTGLLAGKLGPKGIPLALLFGGLEGAGGQAYMVSKDLDQPPGTRAHDEAVKQLPKWLPESMQQSVGPILSDRAIRQGIISGGIGGLMSTKGAISSLLKDKAAASSSTQFPAAAPQVPQNLPIARGVKPSDFAKPSIRSLEERLTREPWPDERF